jgi:molybdate transport system regulatory protein
MKISTRSILAGKVAEVDAGEVNAVVSIDVDGIILKSYVTREAVDDLELAVGKPAYAILKSTSVMFATDRIARISARNQIPGHIASVKKGVVNGVVKLETEQGKVVTGTITNNAIDELGLEPGKGAYAVIKSSDVIIGVEE